MVANPRSITRWPASPLLAAGLAGVGLFQTMLSALSGAVTNDGLAILSVTLTLLAAIHLTLAPRSPRSLARSVPLLFATVALAFLAKRTAVVAIMPATLALLFVIVPWSYHWCARRLLPLAVAGALVALPCSASSPCASTRRRRGTG